MLAAHLMRKRRLNPVEAVDLIRKARPIAEPNSGFMDQLWLYYNIDYSSAPDDAPLYQRWLYTRGLAAARAARTAPQHLHFRDDERQPAAVVPAGRSDSGPAPPAAPPTGLLELRCKKCRCVRPPSAPGSRC